MTCLKQCLAYKKDQRGQGIRLQEDSNIEKGQSVSETTNDDQFASPPNPDSPAYSLAHLPIRTPLDRPTPPDYGMDIKPGGQSSASLAFLVQVDPFSGHNASPDLFSGFFSNLSLPISANILLNSARV